MGAITLLLPLVGSAIGIFGYITDLPWILGIGAALCGLNEFLNIASGVYKLPMIAVILIVAGAMLISPWYIGAMFGLCAAGALDGLGEIYGRLRERRG
jgi:hypothetical protein